MHDSITNLSRRHFLAGAGLVIGVSFLAPNAFAATLLRARRPTSRVGAR